MMMMVILMKIYFIYEMHNRKGLHCKKCSNKDEMTLKIENLTE